MTFSLALLRFDARGEYSTLPSALLVDDAGDMAPDRLPAPGVVAFDTAIGGLVLAPGASAFVTDRTYADVDLDVQAPSGEPAVVVLRDASGRELEVGGPTCPVGRVSGASSMHIERRGAGVTWSVASGAAGQGPAPTGACAGGVDAGARLSIGLRGDASANRSVARALRIVRLREP
jgi:hypothetical protein